MKNINNKASKQATKQASNKKVQFIANSTSAINTVSTVLNEQITEYLSAGKQRVAAFVYCFFLRKIDAKTLRAEIRAKMQDRQCEKHISRGVITRDTDTAEYIYNHYKNEIAKNVDISILERKSCILSLYKYLDDNNLTYAKLSGKIYPSKAKSKEGDTEEQASPLEKLFNNINSQSDIEQLLKLRQMITCKIAKLRKQASKQAKQASKQASKQATKKAS